MRRVSMIIFLYLSTGCHSVPEEASSVYQNYPFDQKVIKKLPVYDSLVTAILEKSFYFQQHIDENESYRAFKYMPGSAQADVFKKLPPDVALKIDHYFNNLGKNYIFGFDVFKDSTIKIYIRNSPSDESSAGIDENLSWYPAGTKIRRRELPDKDTLLNEHWQYWIRINKGRFF